MKTLKTSFLFGIIAILGAISCSKKDGINQDVSALNTSTSTDISKIFDISTDNSGVVKVTPLGSGITSSTINFGHGTGSAATATVAPGGNASHVYPEGTYTVTIVSTDIAGKQTTTTYPLTMTYKAPINLLPNRSIANLGAAVKPTALYANSFKVDFGDGSPVLNIPLTKMENHLYATAGTYNVKVTAISGNALYAGAAFKDTIFPVVITATQANPFALPITFENPSVNYFFGTFGGGQAFTTVANPNATGLNTSANVGRFSRGFESWSGTYSPLNVTLDFAVTKKIKMLVYNTDPTLIGKLINLELESALGGVPGNGAGVKKVAITTSNAWEELVFDFGTLGLPSNSKFNQIVFRFNDAYQGNGVGLGGQNATFFIDNITLTN